MVNGKKVFSGSNRATSEQKLTAQQEYWMNRIFRELPEYGRKVSFTIILFMLLIVAIAFLMRSL